MDSFYQAGGKVIMTPNWNWHWIRAKGGDEMVSTAKWGENNWSCYRTEIWVSINLCGSHILHASVVFGKETHSGGDFFFFFVTLETSESHIFHSAPSRINEAYMVDNAVLAGRRHHWVFHAKITTRGSSSPWCAPRNCFSLRRECLNTEAGDCNSGLGFFSTDAP